MTGKHQQPTKSERKDQEHAGPGGAANEDRPMRGQQGDMRQGSERQHRQADHASRQQQAGTPQRNQQAGTPQRNPQEERDPRGQTDWDDS